MSTSSHTQTDLYGICSSQEAVTIWWFMYCLFPNNRDWRLRGKECRKMEHKLRRSEWKLTTWNFVAFFSKANVFCRVFALTSRYISCYGLVSDSLTTVGMVATLSMLIFIHALSPCPSLAISFDWCDVSNLGETYRYGTLKQTSSDCEQKLFVALFNTCH